MTKTMKIAREYLREKYFEYKKTLDLEAKGKASAQKVKDDFIPYYECAEMYQKLFNKKYEDITHLEIKWDSMWKDQNK